MKLNKIHLLLAVIVLICGCSSQKNILYVQDLDSKKDYKYDYDIYRLKVDDILKIEIGNQDILENNLNIKSLQGNSTVNSKETMIYNGYQINNEGFINHPIIGKVKVVNKTLLQVTKIFTEILINNDIYLSPSVDVKILNTHFTALGEFNKPGRHEFFENNLNILEAIGIAGDLTINGQRKNIKLIRESNNKKIIKNIDLTSQQILDNNFQIISGDIIIVNPNTSRVKNAGIIGNSGTLLSLLSFILSSIIVISNR